LTPIRLEELATVMGAEAVSVAGQSVTGFATDSHSAKPGDLFIAIKGQRVDGHDFASQAFEKGAEAALVERPVDGPYLLVPNVVDALAQFGRDRRSRFEGPVIGVTGSAGKTTTKELISAAVSPLGPVLKSEGNRNSEYTSPLLWADLMTDTKTAVVEMAMRGFGQIAHLASIASPTVGVVTNIGYAHMMQMGSRAGIAQAKGELLEALPTDGLAVIWEEDDFHSELAARSAAKRTVTFGFSELADSRVVEYRPVSWSRSEMKGTVGGKGWTAALPAAGRHIALDAACAVLVAHELGVEPQAAADALEQVKLPPMRMEVWDWHGVTVLMDNYNASPPSMISALETLSEMPTNARKFALLGEMRELGSLAEEAHREVGRFAKKLNLDGIGLLGEDTRFIAAEVNAEPLEDDRAARAFLGSLKPGDAVLVKGSRALQLENLFEEPAVR